MALDEGRDVLAFDHPVFDATPGCNEGARELLKNGAERIVIRCLDRHIITKPSPIYHPRKEQLSFWQARLKGLQALGGSYYVSCDEYIS